MPSSESSEDIDTVKRESWEGSLDRWATEAVKGSNNWLITLRNAEDEGYAPWSDYYTEEESEGNQSTGIMSYSEGLTALSITEEHVKEQRKKGNKTWEVLDEDLYVEDTKKLIGYILDKDYIEDEPTGYTPEPYLPAGLTTDFTDAVSYSTSALLGAITSGIELEKGKDEGFREDLIEALEANVQWFLENDKRTGVDAENALGWAWIGDEDDTDGLYEPQNYYTYSAVYPLCDLLDEDDKRVNEAIEDYRGRIEGHLNEAKNFLVKEHWDGEKWRGPTGSQENKQIAFTCYTILALSYMDAKVDSDGVSLVQEDRKRMSEGINWVLNTVFEKNNIEDVWDKSAEYDCGPDDNYEDGSIPYLVLDTITEFVRFEENIGDMKYVDYTKKEMREKRDELAERILYRCWAGDKDYSRKGFRHIGHSPSLLKGVNMEKNPTVIYTTQVGIETFFLNVLQEDTDEGEREGSAKVKEERKAKKDTGVDTADSPTTGVLVGGEEIMVHANESGELQASAFGVSETDARNLSDRIEKKIERVRQGLKEKLSDPGSSPDMSEAEELNLKFLQRESKIGNDLNRSAQDLVVKIGNKVGADWKTMLSKNRDIEYHCGDVTANLLSELYFETHPGDFRGKVSDFLDDDTEEGPGRSRLLKPWVDEMNSLTQLDDKEIEDHVTRKQKIDESIDSLVDLSEGELSEEELEDMVKHISMEES